MMADLLGTAFFGHPRQTLDFELVRIGGADVLQSAELLHHGTIDGLIAPQ